MVHGQRFLDNGPQSSKRKPINLPLEEDSETVAEEKESSLLPLTAAISLPPSVSFTDMPLDLLLSQKEVSLEDTVISQLRSTNKNKLTILAGKAVETLHDCLSSSDKKVALAAANSVLDRDGIVKPSSLFSDEGSSFAPSVILGALVGAAKVMGLPVNDSLSKRTLAEMEMTSGNDTVSLRVASETSPTQPVLAAEEKETVVSRPPSKPPAKRAPKGSSLSSVDSTLPTELLDSLGGK